MRRISSYLALLGMLFLWSCEEETLEPRTNPRFSVTIVQEISSSGVQFGADIYDYGNEEILEYGFVYTQSTGAPNLNQDDYVASQGRPGEHFELVANHSMTVGKKYFVSAFLRTSTAIVFSKSMEFISQGSEGFIVTSVEWPELIYKAQNLVVKGRRFSKQRANYKVKIGQFDIYPNLVDSTTLILPLPEGLLTETTGQDIEMELRIEISEKVYTEKRILKFQEPVFEKGEVQNIDFGKDVIVRGDYFDIGKGRLICQGQPYQDFTSSKIQMTFAPYKEFGFPKDGEVNPMVYYEVRGIRYEAGRIFEINPSYLDQKEIILKSGENFITGGNFNVLNPLENLFFDNLNIELDWRFEVISSDSILIYPNNGTYLSRDFSMRIKNFGKFSNSVNVKLEMPEVSLRSSGRLSDEINLGVATVFNGKGYVLSSGGIIEESLESGFSNKLLSPLPAVWRDNDLQIKTYKSGLFLYGGGVDFLDKPLKKLFSYSIESRKWEELTDLPNGNYSFSSIHEVSDGIIFEQGYKPGKDSYIEANQERWHFSIINRTWKRLKDTQVEPGHNLLTFNYKDESYAFVHDPFFLSTSLLKYDELTQLWKSLAPAPTVSRISFGYPLIINGKIYVFQPYGENIEFDLETFNFKSMGYSSSNEGIYLFVKGESIFTVSIYGSIMDFKPALVH